MFLIYAVLRDGELDDFVSVLSDREGRQQRQFASRERRSAFRTGAIALRGLVASVSDAYPSRIHIERPCETCGADCGPPAVRSPLIHASVTHSDGLSIVAVSSHRIGVDVEALGGSYAFLHEKGKWSSRRTEAVSRESSDAAPGESLRIWVETEAVAKFLKVGMDLRRDLLQPRLSLHGERLVLRADGWAIARLHRLDGIAGYEAALVTELGMRAPPRLVSLEGLMARLEQDRNAYHPGTTLTALGISLQ